MKADLHIHTTNSDGTKTVKEIIDLASNLKLDYFSITDHDNCDGIEEAIESTNQLQISFIPGIELSTLEQGHPVHVLGYFRDDSYKSSSMKKYYNFIKTKREERAKKYIENLRKFYNLDITYEEVYSLSKGVIARPHIATAIKEKYPEYDYDEIFDKFLLTNGKAYVPSTKLSVQEGISLLRENNCLVILAHPTLLHNSIKEKVFQYNFDGYEARYYRNKVGEEEQFIRLAQLEGKAYTAGSDYHGIDEDSKHGYIGEVTLNNHEIEQFLKAYKKQD